MDEFPVKLVTERNLNKYISPVISIKGKQIEKKDQDPVANKDIEGYPVANKDIEGLSVCDQGTIGADELMLLDTLGTYITHGLYNCEEGHFPDFSKRLPKNSDHAVKQFSGSRIPSIMLPQVIEKIKNDKNDTIPEWFYNDQEKSLLINGVSYTMHPPMQFVVTDSFLFKQIPVLKNKLKTSKRLFELFERTAGCKLRMNFPIVLYHDGKYNKYPYPNISSNLFRFEVKNDKISSNGNVLSRKYSIKFDTLFGYFFIQNVLSCHTSLLPGHFYNMTEYAQLFYRTLILLYYDGFKIPISLKEIKARLVLKSDDSMSRKVVMRILKELELNRFISNPEEIPKDISKDGSYWYKYKKNDWKTLTGAT